MSETEYHWNTGARALKHLDHLTQDCDILLDLAAILSTILLNFLEQSNAVFKRFF